MRNACLLKHQTHEWMWHHSLWARSTVISHNLHHCLQMQMPRSHCVRKLFLPGWKNCMNETNRRRFVVRNWNCGVNRHKFDNLAGHILRINYRWVSAHWATYLPLLARSQIWLRQSVFSRDTCRSGSPLIQSRAGGNAHEAVWLLQNCQKTNNICTSAAELQQ